MCRTILNYVITYFLNRISLTAALFSGSGSFGRGPGFCNKFRQRGILRCDIFEFTVASGEAPGAISYGHINIRKSLSEDI